MTPAKTTVSVRLPGRDDEESHPEVHARSWTVREAEGVSLLRVGHRVLPEVLNGPERWCTTHDPRLGSILRFVANAPDDLRADTNDAPRRDVVTCSVESNTSAVEGDIEFLLSFVGVWCRRLAGVQCHRVHPQLSTAEWLGEFPVKRPRLGKPLLFDILQFDHCEVRRHTSHSELSRGKST